MDFKPILEAGQANGEPKVVTGGGMYAVVPEGADIKDLTPYMPRPARADILVQLRDVASFGLYVNRFATDASLIFADPETPCVKAVIDYHAPAEADHCGHVAKYSPPLTEEWQTWRANSGVKMKQAEFARFIEENRMDIAEPPGAEVLEIARSLQAKRQVEFTSGVRLSSGDHELTYNEKTTTSGGKRTLTVPEEMKLAMPVFLNQPLSQFTAFLRYRIEDGALSFWYDIHRPQQVLHDAFMEVVDGVTAATGRDVLLGAL